MTKVSRLYKWRWGGVEIILPCITHHCHCQVETWQGLVTAVWKLNQFCWMKTHAVCELSLLLSYKLHTKVNILSTVYSLWNMNIITTGSHLTWLHPPDFQSSLCSQALQDEGWWQVEEWWALTTAVRKLSFCWIYSHKSIHNPLIYLLTLPTAVIIYCNKRVVLASYYEWMSEESSGSYLLSYIHF